MADSSTMRKNPSVRSDRMAIAAAVEIRKRNGRSYDAPRPSACLDEKLLSRKEPQKRPVRAATTVGETLPQASGVADEFVSEIIGSLNQVALGANPTSRSDGQNRTRQAESGWKPMDGTAAEQDVDLGSLDILASDFALVDTMRNMGGKGGRCGVGQLACCDETNRPSGGLCQLEDREALAALRIY